jgi:hypothetical protein
MLEKIKNQIINFLEANYNEFSNLEDSETCTLDLSEDLNYEIVKYLKSIERFDYRGLCIYYVIEEDEVWVENMAA